MSFNFYGIFPALAHVKLKVRRSVSVAFVEYRSAV